VVITGILGAVDADLRRGLAADAALIRLDVAHLPSLPFFAGAVVWREIIPLHR
jgi:hypothetical protein